MLFNSYEFLFLFLPLTWIGYFFFHARSWHTPATLWLLAASLAFYAYWNPLYLPLLIVSIVVNFSLGFALTNIQSKTIRFTVFVFGILLNLAALGYFKYTNFFLSNVDAAFGTSFDLLHIVLPLGISFFTFTQIAYLIDVYRREVNYGLFKTYALFVTFFPHLIAGPIVHHKEMMSQFADADQWKPNYHNITLGFFLLTIGLFKKVIFADSLSVWANAGFDATQTLSFFEAWIASVAYSFQLYFDFSAYSDMAIGIALFFNIQLPLNFNSPYKAHSLRDFWQRWHMTLTRFLREYVYFPLGGNRNGEWSTARNTLIVFGLAGLWHGAGWTFVVWGLLNGFGLMIGSLWERTGIVVGTVWARILTLLFVNTAWVFFRASSLERAVDMLQSMMGLHGIVLPVFLSPLAIPGVSFAKLFAWSTNTESVLFAAILIIVSFGICLYADNAWELSKRFKPSPGWFIGMACSFLIVLYFMDDVSSFIYFNF
jgi:alginate O-acetyltransferase complex protein AlgI